MYDFAIVGGGIIGLSVGKAIYERFPDAKVIVLEKEKELATHQTGHNSGVIHSGIYYKPGSYKALFARQGNQSMKDFCNEYNIDHDNCGKVIVATKQEELPLLDDLYERGLQNELNINKLDRDELLEIEPHVDGVAGIQVMDTGIVDYVQVTKKFAEIIESQGATISLNTKVEKIHEKNDEVIIETNQGEKLAKYLINCGGLYSDKIAEASDYKTDMKIIPFRGEYYKLKPEKRHLVKNLIYPVPNPKFPFLGVHFTRMVNGDVEAGPNAILSLKREGYKKFGVNMKELSEVLTYSGFWKMAAKFGKEAVSEYYRSFNKTQFTNSLREIIPEITADDLIAAPAGVRAQALGQDGTLVDDFQIIEGKNSIHVCNAPSPAATASIEIGKEIAGRLRKPTKSKSVSI